VRLSKRGLKAVAGADRLYTRIEKKLLAGLPASEASQFITTLKTILGAQSEDGRQSARA
jgi:DNA-binding MarR family transcriptional regulator